MMLIIENRSETGSFLFFHTNIIESTTTTTTSGYHRLCNNNKNDNNNRNHKKKKKRSRICVGQIFLLSCCYGYIVIVASKSWNESNDEWKNPFYGTAVHGFIVRPTPCTTTVLLSSSSSSLSSSSTRYRRHHHNCRRSSGVFTSLQQQLDNCCFDTPTTAVHTTINNNTTNSAGVSAIKSTIVTAEGHYQSIHRRALLRNVGALTTASFMSSLPFTSSSSNIANAAKAEIDVTTGNLFTPKADMLRGGSNAARGLSSSQSSSSSKLSSPISSSSSSSSTTSLDGTKNNRRVTLRPGQSLQSIYETRFVAYLSRFLLNFEPSARAYWVQQGFGDSWEYTIGDGTTEYDNSSGNGITSSEQRDRSADVVFAEFAQSVEVGLADYFSGPYGSYSSIPAMVAGIDAAQPAPSKKADPSDDRHSFLDDIFRSGKASSKIQKRADSISFAKQGILNLYTLLKARYNSLPAKRQLAILFSFVSSPDLQPVNEICSLLGEADNTTVTAIEIVNTKKVTNEIDSRTSSRRGGGYAYGELPEITITKPPPLGDEYRDAQLLPIMEPTSRVLRIMITDHGEGYTSAPTVTIVQNNGLVIRQCQATAIIDRDGHVESIFVLDPGYGYGGGRKNIAPKVIIEPPTDVSKPRNNSLRPAKAFAKLEYKISNIRIVDGGTGFVATEPPKIKITPPTEDPDWYLDVQELPTMRMVPVATNTETLQAFVTEMRYADGNIAYSNKGMPDRSNVINDNLIERLVRDPLELLPSTARPELVQEPRSGKMIYSIPRLALVPQFVAVMSPRYRAYDPIFGGVGRIPVTKGANALTVSEYARLALSGAVCTVAVRTALNPLELVKTKQQLQNDIELLDYAQSKVNKTRHIDIIHSKLENARMETLPAIPRSTTTAVIAPPDRLVSVAQEQVPTKVKIGTIDMIRSIIELRGPLALFQSADITFLASLVFGSLGFGATELFRRSFTSFFLAENGGVKSSASESELVLLFAASVATVLTAFAASPFEVLRVRSMGLVTPKKWTEVLEDFLEEKSSSGRLITNQSSNAPFDFKSIRIQDISPLWSGFAPILSRELPFAIAKFLVFDFLSTSMITFVNSQNAEGTLPIQIGVGPTGLVVSALAGAFAGIAGAVVSHPADLILTKTSSTKAKFSEKINGDYSSTNASVSNIKTGPAWVVVVKELIAQDGGVSNLFVGLGSRSIFFFLVIGLQFFLYDYVKGLFQVSSDDLTLVLDVFYAVRAGLVGVVDST